MRCVNALALASVLLAGAGPVAAQQSVDYASVGGRVTDSSGAVLPGADVSIRHTGTNVTATAPADADGRFRFPYLKIGPYEIAVHHPGFREFKRLLTLTAGAAYELPVILEVGTLDTSVTVTGEIPTVETARTQLAATVSQAEVDSLPLNGRNLLDLALLVPGVAPAGIASTQLFPETSAVPGVSLSVGSQRNLSNNFIVDGLSANDDAAALSGMAYGIDAVEQLQVVTSGGQAELGRALGGYVNVVTRSGTNVRRGTTYGFFRDDRLNASNPLSGTKLPMRQSQYGASLGGPVRKDRTFYFANVEQRRLRQSGLTTISPADVDAVNARLAAAGYGGPRLVTGEYPNPVDATTLLGKVDHQASGSDQIGFRYSRYDADAQNARGAGALSAPSASTHLDNADQTFAVHNTLTLSARTVLETRAQLSQGDLTAPPSDPIGPAVSIAGVAVFGTSAGSPTGRFNRLYQVVNNLSHQAGAHAVRAGVDVLVNDLDITYPRSARGSYSFSSLGSFLRGVYNNAGFAQTFGASAVSLTNPNLGVYLQDEWKVHSRVTVNAGLRYDLQFLETIRTDTDNLSPRVGVAWSPFESRRTIVRASAGVFYDRVPLRPLANALLSAGNTTDPARLRQVIVTRSPAEDGAPVFPAILDDVAGPSAPVNFTTMDRDLQNAYSRQVSVEVERQLAERTTIGVAYQYLRGFDLLMSVNQNVPRCAAAGDNNGCRPDPVYANDNRYSAAGASSYHGLHLSIVQRPARWGQFRISYTLSRAMNNVGEFFFSAPIDPTDISKDWGRSDDDQRHRLVVSGSVQSSMEPAATLAERITNGFRLSGLVQAYSAAPFNITSGVTTIQGTAARPVVNGEYIARNAGVGSAFFTLNARVSRAFRVTGRVRVEAVVEGFNLTNRSNVVTRNTNFGTGAYPSDPLPSFGQVTAVAEPRSFQLGVRLAF